MSNIKEKAPACQPMLIPVTPSFEVDDSPFVEPLHSSGEPENSQEWQEHDLLLPFGEVGTYIALVNKRDDDFTTIDNSTLSRVIEAGCSNQLTIYLLLHQRSYTDLKTGKLVAIPTTYAWLIEQTGFSLSKVKNHIKKLNDAELINCYSTRQMAEPGNSKQAGNCYGINYRRYTGKPRAKNASTYVGTTQQLPKSLDQPVTSYSTPRKTENTKAALSTSSEVTVDEEALSSPKMNPPSGQKWSPDYCSSKDSSKDLLREQAQKSTELGRRIPVNDGKLDDPISFSEMAQPMISRLKKTDEPTESNTQASPATVNQLAALDKHLKAWTAGALRHYGVKSLNELSAKQADQLIKLTQDQNDLLKNKLAPICLEIQSEQLAEKTRLDYEAAQEQKRLDDEADKAAQEEQIATYGRVLTLADKKQLCLDALKAKR